MSKPLPETEIITFPFIVPGKQPKKMCVFKGVEALSITLKTTRVWEYNSRIKLYMQMGQGGSYVEVGANIGTDTVLAADFFKQCYLFEPSTSHCGILKQNMELNQIANYKLFAAAVSDHCGSQRFYAGPEHNPGSASLLQNHPGMDEFEDVQVVTLDSALADVTDVTYLHIDTEGHDIKVLLGARNFLARQKQRPFIKMEFQPRTMSQHGSDISELVRLMDEFKYKAYVEANGFFAPLGLGMLVDMFYSWRATEAWIDIYLKAG